MTKSPFDPKHWPKIEGLPDLLVTQQRSFEAMTRAGQILGDAMRQCAEQQMQVAKSAFDQLVSKASPAETSADLDWKDHSRRLQTQIEQLVTHLTQMQDIMVGAHQAALAELQSIWQTTARAAKAAPSEPARAPAPAAAPEPRPTKPVIVVNHDRHNGHAAAPPAAAPKAAEPARPKAEPAPVAAAAPEAPKAAPKRPTPRVAKKPPLKN